MISLSRITHLAAFLFLLLASVKLSGVLGQSGADQTLDDATLRRMLINQPDYVALQQFGFTEPKGGFGATSRVAKLGHRFREEDDDRIMITEPGKATIRIYPKRREFSEVPPEKPDRKDDDIAVAVEELAGRKDVDFKMLGMDTVGVYPCRRIEATYQDQRLREMKFVLCLAPKLNNLVVFQQALLGPVTMTTVLSEVSLNVSEELFRIPSQYKRVQEKADEQFKELTDGIKQAAASQGPTPFN